MFRATRFRWTTSLSIQIFQAGATNLQLCQGKRLLENMDLTFLLIKNKQRQQKMSKNVYSSKTITTYKLKKIIKNLNAHKIIIKLKDVFLWSSFHISVLTLKLLATNAKDFITIYVVIQISTLHILWQSLTETYRRHPSSVFSVSFQGRMPIPRAVLWSISLLKNFGLPQIHSEIQE